MPNSPDPQAPDLGFCDRRTCILGLTQQSPRVVGGLHVGSRVGDRLSGSH